MVADSSPNTLKRQIACVRREIAMREAVYPKRVLRGDMTQKAMDSEIEAMKAVLNTLENLDSGDYEAPPF